ncbi:hypothetical protein NQ317_011798 [Molorchus minor]|uniref:C2H2-type domain-containing protein n=1 Tax=Molorchus minor TaxID=1323400 RepID=A0ABQ9J6R7_9CUCU|nr:hypothetical protein NQ317_011798 [Molorchus minor]
MDIKEEKVCRLCLGELKGDHRVIENYMKEQFKILLLDVNLDVSENPVLCENCAEQVQKSFDFKTACISKEVTMLCADVNRTNNLPLTEHFMDDVNSVFAYDDVCYFCKERQEKSSFIELNKLKNEYGDGIFQHFFPEKQNNEIPKEPITCTSCVKYLAAYFGLIRTCEATEINIREYCKQEGTNSKGFVKLSNVQSFLYKDASTFSAILDPVFIKKEEPVFDNAETDYININDIRMKLEGQTETIKADCATDSSMIFAEIDIYECQICSFKTKNKFSLTKHRLVHKDNSEVAVYQCGTCSFQTKYKNNLTKHLLLHKDNSEIALYQCEFCEFKTKHKNNLSKHFLVHKDCSEVEMFQCELCDYKTKHKNCFTKHLLVHKDSSEVETYKCMQCNYTTKYKRYLSKHLLVHKDPSEVKHYDCDLCSFRTKHKTNLTKHLLVHKDSSEIEWYNCEKCSYTTKYKRFLNNHRLIHKDPSEVEMYSCEQCSYTTKHKSCLARHSLIHKDTSEVEMYSCELCDYTTKYKRYLSKHMLIKHPTEVEVYNCDVCDFKTKHQNNLAKHMLNHTESLNGGMYGVRTLFVQDEHLPVHKDPSELEMYRCDICNFQTKHKYYLNKHRVIHTPH